MIDRIRNRLIKLLGGYTQEEYDEEALPTKLSDIAIPVVESTENFLPYDGGLYLTQENPWKERPLKREATDD